MKKFFFMAIAAAAITSCSQDEVMEVTQKEAINFGNPFVENATRAIDNTYHSQNNMPTSFKVYGTTKGNESGTTDVTIFNGVDVSGSGNTWNYGEAYTQYWINGNTYNFAAVVGGTINNDKTISYKANYTEGNATDVDLLYDKDNYGVYTKVTSDQMVTFNFTHLLSKVHFTVKNTIASNVKGNVYTYKVTDVKISNALPTGSYDITKYLVENQVGWTASGTGIPVSFGHVTNAVKNADVAEAVAIGTWTEDGETKGISEATSHYARLLIPATYTKDENDLENKTGLIIECTITTYLNGQSIDVESYKKSIGITLAEGKAYNFVISKGNPGDPIKFSATMSDWLNGNTHDSNNDNINDYVPVN